MSQLLLESRFDHPVLDPQLSWLNPPARWSIDHQRGVLRVEPRAGTDLWRRTHYGFEVDNAHCLLARVEGDFVLQTCVTFQPVHQYDQAGLVVRVSPECWLKTAIEFEPQGPWRLGAVVTNTGYSDWSTQDVPAGHNRLEVRIRREGSDYLVEHLTADEANWSQIRMAHLHEDTGGPVDCGLYACSPKGAGFVAEFTSLLIRSGRLDSDGG